MIVKVCGMREQSNIDALTKLPIDLIGFIFYPKSSRFVEAIEELTTDGVERVGVFVDSDGSNMLELAERYSLSHLQLHGVESVEICRELRAKGYKVIKAISVSSAEDFELSKIYDGEVDYLLFDTKCVGYGGSGVRFDWKLLDSYSGSTPFLLSGGIDIDQALEIKEIKHPQFYGVDLNSRFEISPAVKDVEKLNDFLKIIRNN